ncbi:MAG: hypothetical protein IKG87_07165 [Clostridia bacterium]|nr:hypothetical protein [Clostridia bacterium]
MKKILTMILCMMICCTAACAENSVSISAEGEDWMSYAFTLPDGRMIFTGSRGKVGNYQEQKARLLCLNPDRTVSWEYWDPAEGYAHFRGAALLADGTIGVVYINSPYQETEAIEIRKFSTEGKPIGNAIDIFGKGKTSGLVDDITSACIRMNVYTDDGKEQRGFLNWKGNLIFSFDRKKMIGVRSTFAAGDGLVLAGNEISGSSNAKIMKVDMQGNVIWETVLPLMLENGARAWIDKCVQTPDGGYLAWIIESDYNSDQWAHALVRFDQNGRKLWLNRESFDDTPTIGCTHLIEYQGKAVMLERNNSLGRTQVYHWFDEGGNAIGKTELTVSREDAGSNQTLVQVMPQGMIIMNDGLWVLNDLRIRNDKDVRKEMDSKDDVLYKVPVPNEGR